MEQKKKLTIKLLTDNDNPGDLISNMEYNVIIAGEEGKK